MIKERSNLAQTRSQTARTVSKYSVESRIRFTMLLSSTEDASFSLELLISSKSSEIRRRSSAG